MVFSAFSMWAMSLFCRKIFSILSYLWFSFSFGFMIFLCSSVLCSSCGSMFALGYRLTKEIIAYDTIILSVRNVLNSEQHCNKYIVCNYFVHFVPLGSFSYWWTLQVNECKLFRFSKSCRLFLWDILQSDSVNNMRF